MDNGETGADTGYPVGAGGQVHPGGADQDPPEIGRRQQLEAAIGHPLLDDDTDEDGERVTR